MGDFYQNGFIATLHNFRSFPLEDLEARLREFSKQRPMALVLPCLYSELEGPALPHILDELSKVDYLNEIVIGLDRADENQFKHAKQFFSRLPQDYRILWNDGPRMMALNALLEEKKIAPKELGKGRNAWFCFGYLNATAKSEAIALHDCDILTYDREMLARLLYPVADPTFNFRFCKGYYYRASDEKLNGRVTRLLVMPLLRALEKMFGYNDFLQYIDSFRYPLAGEFSMRADVMKTISIPSDWGLEIGILSEVHRFNSPSRVCQVEIADRYDHKHQELSANDKNAGLSKMSIDIARAIFRRMASEGTIFSKGAFRSLKSAYYRIATETIEKYYADSIINGLSLDRHQEETSVDMFAQNIYHAGNLFLTQPMQSYSIPSWKRVASAIPEFMDLMLEAVELDNNE